MAKATDPKYPWDYWLGLKAFTLRKGEDFKCQVHGMAQQIRNAAKARGIRVSLSISSPLICVTIIERPKKTAKSSLKKAG